MKHRLSLAGAVLMVTLAILLLFIGIERYGSLDGLWRRASAEVNARPAAPDPGADAAPDRDDPAYKGRHVLTDRDPTGQSAVIRAVSYRDAQPPHRRTCGHAHCFRHPPGCQPNHDERGHPITHPVTTHTHTPTQRPAAHDVCWLADARVADVE